MIFDVRNYGAVGDGKTLNTIAIQKAIDDCVSSGGGRVLVSGGIYLIGSITIGSGVDLHITETAILLGSGNCDDYIERKTDFLKSDLLPRWRNACLIYAEQSENIMISGHGVIDCNGKCFVTKATPENRWGGWDYTRIQAPTPPRVVFFAGCKNISIKDIKMINQPAGWSYWIHDCDFVEFNNVKIHAEVEYPNNDGIHINCSRDVEIKNCDITCGDDSIIIRANSASLKENKTCERVKVNNCRLTSYSAGIRFGWARDGVIRNCEISDIEMFDCSTGIDFTIPDYERDPERKKLYTADLGCEKVHIENISIYNVIIHEVYGHPVRIHAVPSAKIDVIKDITFDNIKSKSYQHIKMEGLSDNPIKNVVFNNCNFEIVNQTDFGGREYHGSVKMEETNLPIIKNIEGLVFNNTAFTIV